jgi:SGNH domain (fused to AT3 domains)
MSRRRHTAIPILVAALLVVGAACGSSGSAKTASTTPNANAPLPARVSTAQVIAAVRAAEGTKRLPSTINANVLQSVANDAVSAWAIPGCDPSPDSATALASLSGCTFGATTYKHTVMVIGDSHAAMWQPAFDLLARRIGWRVIDLTLNNCGPAAIHYYLYPESREFSQCDAWQKWRMTEINKIRPSIVVLTGEIGGAGPSVKFTPALWQAGIEKTIRQIQPGIQTVVLGDLAALPTPGPECLAKNSGNIQACSTPVATLAQRANNQSEAAAAAATGASYVDVTPWFCADVCPDAIAGIDVYTGKYHVNHDYAAYLSGAMESALEPEINKA